MAVQIVPLPCTLSLLVYMDSAALLSMVNKWSTYFKGVQRLYRFDADLCSMNALVCTLIFFSSE